MNARGGTGGQCASLVSSAIGGIGPFKDLGTYILSRHSRTRGRLAVVAGMPELSTDDFSSEVGAQPVSLFLTDRWRTIPLEMHMFLLNLYGY